ncbi:MAG: ABC-F family ATP-binding cassette domain-containing protein [Oscillospiraceae bacterium]|jgi:ATPase subunit of ABC transporter with duplicated ATPase domains|nr:ABC-F family ATP-binding cassette domain-containing protein [Oscillospiraceae bacterium]
MIDIAINNVVKAFEEGNNILDGVSFNVNSGERVGLLGKNGAGKTTLFRLIIGELESDEGDVVVPADKKLGLISQIPRYPEGFTVEDVLCSAHAHLRSVKRRMDELTEQMERVESNNELLREYDALAFEFERSGGYTMETERNRVANGLLIPKAQREQLFDTLSGGEKTRANLARLILEDTNILLLDEPTNHLDMRAVEWLEDYLAKFKGTVLAISHDRYFLDKIVTRTVEIANGKAEFYGGNYSYYVVEKQRRLEEQLKRYEREQAEAKRLQAAADKLRQWGTLDKGSDALVVKARAIETRIERLTKTERPNSDRHIKARFGERDFRADEALVMRGVTKSYGEKRLFTDVELEVKPGERIALIGDNGSGKSTLIRLIMGEEKPDAGIIKRGPAAKFAFLPQIVKFDHPYRSALDTFVSETNSSVQTARNRLGAFKFSGEDVFKLVSALSGGEQSRLRLCILMNEEINFLILDEPTNHLDISSREWIEEAVSDFDGTLLFVSHDRYFIERFATRVWEIDGGEFTDFHGTFEQLRAAKAKPQDVKRAVTVKKEDTRPPRARDTAKQVAKLEREIAAIETKLADVAAERWLNASDFEKLLELDDDEARLNAELEGKYDELVLLDG